MGDWIRHHLSRRPAWMNALLLFCAYMTFVYVPWDLFAKPAAIDEEVWFGIRFHGAWAKLLALPHWAVYGAGVVGFWGMRAWMWPWAALYAGQVAFGMLVWPLVYVGGGRGLAAGLVAGGAFGGLTLALWASRPRFHARPPSLAERYGGWALVTGASAGIGAEFARAFARDGVPCVLVARRADRLRALAAELQDVHKVEARVVSADLAAPDGAQRVLAALGDLDVGILVNNAGVGYSGAFERQDPKRLVEMVRLHCTAPVELTAALLPRLRARGRGAIVFSGSVAGCQPLPLHAVYAASKAFDNLLGEALWAELFGSGIDVLALEPGPTETEFQAAAGELPHPGEAADRVVAAALRALGHQPSVISGWFNWIRANAAMRIPPRSLLTLAARRVMEAQTPPEMR
jgi:hypothetical protein